MPTIGADDSMISGIGTLLAGVGALLGAAGGWWMGRMRLGANVIAERHREDAAQTEAITRRFQLLMDGYEKRIQDLTAEVHSLRAELASMRLEFEVSGHKLVGY